jgi:hypothetical protein
LSAANFANGSYSPVVPYTRYVDEAIYFTDDPSVVTTFQAKFDDLWTDTAHYTDYANVTRPLMRRYPPLPLYNPELNFPPDQDYQDRLVAQMKLERQRIDVAMFRITSAKVPDEMIRRVQAGVPVRLITDQRQYRNPTYFWHSYNVDRMHIAGIPIKWKVKDSGQDMHQKSVVLYSRGMAIFGSSNWTTSSSNSQREHNYFASKPWLVQWFIDQFERKWGNRKADVDGGAPIDPLMFVDFLPLSPDTPGYVSPANAGLGVGSPVTLSWEGGYWAHKYDIYVGTSSPPALAVQDFMPGSRTAGISSNKESYTFASLSPGTVYYWRIVSKTMANKTRAGPIWSFTTAGLPSSDSSLVVTAAADAYVRNGPSAARTFGSATELLAKFSANPDYEREAYLKFDLSGVAAGDLVTLRLFGRLSDTRESTVRIMLHSAGAVSWDEDTMTWNSKPALTPGVLGSLVVAGTTPQWYQIDLTAFVQAQRFAGAEQVTIALKGGAETLPYAAFSSSETASGPQLVISNPN